jgi:hypothetical protein
MQAAPYHSSASDDSGNTNGSASTSLEITCTTCYIKGDVMAEFKVNGSFNATNALKKFETNVISDVKNITSEAVDDIETYFKSLATSIGDDFVNFDFDSLPAFPTLDLDFNLHNITSIPECEMRFQFDGLELFMAIDTKLSAGGTYTINLYSSNSPIGIAISKQLRLGVIFAIDLILSVEAEIDISSGFHIKLDDGLSVDISMFGQDVSGVNL